MSITDELRAWAKGSTLSSWTAEHLTAIADHIDAEYKKACDDAWDNGYEADYLGIEKWLTEHPQVMEHHGWICLPKDVDGEYIHIGDVLTDDAEFKSEGKVMRLMLEDEGWMVGLGCGGWTEPSIHEWHHHHAPTVEDVLQKLLEQAAGYSDAHTTVAFNAIAEYAKRLTLAESEDA